jgi:hypothetical protein
MLFGLFRGNRQPTEECGLTERYTRARERTQIACPHVCGNNSIIQLIQENTFICAPLISKVIGNIV